MSNIELVTPKKWVVAYYGQKFYLTDAQKSALLDGVSKKIPIIKIDEMYFTDKFSYIAPVDKLENKPNPITDDEVWRKAQLLMIDGKDYSHLLQSLDARYPYKRFAKEWDEANKQFYARDIHDGERDGSLEIIPEPKQVE